MPIRGAGGDGADSSDNVGSLTRQLHSQTIHNVPAAAAAQKADNDLLEKVDTESKGFWTLNFPKADGKPGNQRFNPLTEVAVHAVATAYKKKRYELPRHYSWALSYMLDPNATGKATRGKILEDSGNIWPISQACETVD